VDDKLWGQIGEIAKEQGRPATAVVIDALKRYVTWNKRQGKRADEAGQQVEGQPPEAAPGDD
jgi:predicted transcriptional regulator